MMRITDVEAHALSSPIDPPQTRAFHGGERTILKRDAVLVVVETSDGTVGVAPSGASSSAMREHFSDLTQDTLVGVINDIVAPTIEDSEFADPEAGVAAVAEINLPTVISWEVRSVVDIALYDIFGKEQGVPICDLLPSDEEPTTTLPLYASAGMYMTPEEYASEARTLADEGFFGYKYRPGIGPEGDRRTIEAIQNEVGDEIEIMVDAHTWWKMGENSYDPEEVRELIDHYHDHDVFWVEEPVEPADYDAYRSIHESTDAPLAGGESEESQQGLIDLIDTETIDFLQGDVRHHGGFSGCWPAVEHCHEAGVTFVPHNFGTNLGLVANGHLTAAAPGSHLLEYPVYDEERYPGMYPFPLAEDILKTDLDIENGEITLPDGPGLGVEVNLDVIKEYPHVEGAWTEFEYV